MASPNSIILASNNITGLYSIFSCLVPRNSEFNSEFSLSPQISEFGGRQNFFSSPKLWTQFTPLGRYTGHVGSVQFN